LDSREAHKLFMEELKEDDGFWLQVTQYLIGQGER